MGTGWGSVSPIWGSLGGLCLLFPWPGPLSAPHPTLISSLLNPSPGTLKGSPWLDSYQPQEGLGEGTQVMEGVSTPPPHSHFLSS